MKLTFIDSINGKRYQPEQMGGLLQQGRWLLQLSVEEHGLSQMVYNNHTIPIPLNTGSGIYMPVFTDLQGNFQLQCFTEAGERYSWQLALPEGSELPEELNAFIADFYRRLNSQLDKEQRFAWSSMEDISFFASREMSSTAEWTELDEAIHSAIPSILYICHRPRRHLTTEDALLPVEKVKRVTSSTLSHLAGHSEHWLTRTITGVKPKRMMTEVYDDKYDLYENCALITLVNKLFLYVNNKMDDLQKIETDLIRKQEAEHFATEFNNFRRLRRLEELWKRNEDLQSSINDIKDLTEQISVLYDQLIQAIYSPLYRKLSRAQEIMSPLKATNLFIFDPNYSKVGELWHIFSTYNSYEKEEVESDGSLQMQGYYVFCLTAVLFALKQLDYLPISGQEHIRLTTHIDIEDRPLILNKGDWTIEVSVREVHKLKSIRIQISNNLNIPNKVIQLSPIASMMPKYESDVRTIIDSLYEASIDQGVGENQYYLHLSGVDALPDDLDPKYVRLTSTFGDNFMDRKEYSRYGGGKFGLFAVSPWDANSIERIGRLLLFHTTGEQLMQMDRYEAVLSYLKSSSLPDKQQIVQFIKKNRSDIQAAESSDSKSHVYKKLVQSIPQYDRIRFDSLWKTSNAMSLQECPVCSSSHIHHNENGSNCNECRSAWGARSCSNCFKPVPKLVPGFNLDEAISQEQFKKLAITMENLLGRDMLSPLCESPSHFGSMWVLCPHCGHCMNSESCEDCTHCQHLASH